MKIEKKPKFQADEDKMQELESLRVKKLEDETDVPKSRSDFEKNILRNPNNTEMWIQYIGFVYETEGIASSRKLGKRALAVINFRDDSSRMNLWKARINLEFFFGTEKSTADLFKLAVNSVDHFALCQHMVQLYSNKGEWSTAENFVIFNLKRSKKGKKSWSEYIKFLYNWLSEEEDEEKKQEVDKKIEEIYKRAKQSLPSKDFIFFTSQKGLEEFKKGEVERGRTTFEILVSTYPKRTDLWILFLDMEVKYGDDPIKARALFDRAVSLNLKPKSMKTIFIKYMNYEKKQNDPKKIQMVKEAASRFIENEIAKKKRKEQGFDEEYEEPEEYVI